MSMLEYNEITVRKYIIHESEPYEVMENHVARTQQRKPQNKTRIKNLLNGRMVDVSYHASDKVEEAEIDEKEAKFLYTTKGEFWFCESNDPSKRFKISEDVLGVKAKFLKANTVYKTTVFEDKIFGVKLPATVDLKVTEAPPGVKGDTARGGNKLAKVETGAMITVPLFVNEGDIIKINTETGEYRERV
jgi:elongation factor P